ncbi:MAG: methionyl-tRNA formyltransferase [Acidobacteria bacterium SCN 69-37]|nr:MAG: methionyl-tRNA formyltransferase [Acidobacteria bacterium SCN 69-37]
MRVAFFGTPTFAVPTLDAIAASSHTIAGVITQPDRARGRGQQVTLAPVKARALALGVPVLQPDRLKDEGFLEAFDRLGADIGVVAAYGRLLPQVLLDRPRLGLVNVHASLLPRWRGAAPIHRAVIAGDREAGITIMRVVLALDAGAMLATAATLIDPDETSMALEARLATMGATRLVEVLDRLARGPVTETPQDEARVTYAHRLERADGDLDWARPAREVHDRIRGLHPWPHAAARLGDRRVLLIESRVAHETPTDQEPGTVIVSGADGLVVATAPGAVRLLRLQPEGRPVMAVRDFLNGRPVHVGDRFTPPIRPA